MKIFMYLMIVLFGLLLLIVGATYMVLTFDDKRFDSSSVTHNGFALLAALAAVGFSWARNIEYSHEVHLKKYVNAASRYCLLGAILFIVSSLSKYKTFFTKGSSENNSMLTYFIFAGDLIYPPFFLFAYLVGMAGMLVMFYCLMRCFYTDVIRGKNQHI